MSFIKEVKNSVIEQKEGTIHNLNDKVGKFLFDGDSKILIVGTITPPKGMDYGFYYVTNRYLYKFLSTYFNDDKFYKYAHDKAKKQQLFELTKSRNIAMLDVVKSCERIIPFDASDDNLINITLDYESFRDLKNVKLIIATSKNVEYCLVNMEMLIESERGKIKYLSLFNRHTGFSYEEWKKAFDEALK